MESEKKLMEMVYPKHNFLGEKTSFKNNLSKCTWMVDHIDGTSIFAAGIPYFGVLICLMKKFKSEFHQT